MKKQTKNQKRKRRLKGMREVVRNINIHMNKRRLASQGKYVFPDKVIKEKPPLKPYRLVLLRQKLDRLEQQYRETPHEAKREREKLAEKIQLLKTKLGKKNNQ